MWDDHGEGGDGDPLLGIALPTTAAAGGDDREEAFRRVAVQVRAKVREEEVAPLNTRIVKCQSMGSYFRAIHHSFRPFKVY